MRRLIGLIVLGVVLFANGVVFAGTCGNGVTCFSAALALSNSNQSSPNPLPIYTAPVGGFGAKITALWVRATVASGAQANFMVYTTHAGVPNLLYMNTIDVNATTNFLVTGFTGANPLPGAPTDEYGNPYLYLAPGDSLAIANYIGIPASGSTSGVYYFTAEGQSY